MDIRRMAASSLEPERQRKLLVLADELEERAVELEVSTKDLAAPVER